jgi:hypothetical protein
MLDWFVERVMRAAGVVAGWFLLPDDQKFGLVQLGAGLLLVTGLIALVAFWPGRRARRNRAPGDDRR